MFGQRQRGIAWALAVGLLAWGLALGGFYIARATKVTAEKVRAYLRGVDLAKLQGEARAKALRDLAKKLNALGIEERRRARLDREWAKWFQEMSDAEKAEFVEATLPTGVKQMLSSFEELPEARRRKAIDDALKRLKDAREEAAAADGADPGAQGGMAMNEDLRRKIATTGLKTFYNESSAQTKAEVAPLLEEIQRMMERGAMFRPPHP